MSDRITVQWSERSLRNAQKIIKYLSISFSANEIDQFYKLLYGFEKTVSKFPTLYPFSIKYPNLRKAVLNKRLIVFYRLKGDSLHVVSMKDSRQNKPGS